MSTTLSAMRAPGFFKLLANDIRRHIVILLARSDYRGQELVCRLKQPQNLVSYHLKLLHDEALVTERRSTADERSIYYSLDHEAFRRLYFATGDTLHPAFGTTETDTQETASSLPSKPARVLFLCTHNSARSQMAEGIMRHLSEGRVEVRSAGNQPSEVHPTAIQVLQGMGIDISQQKSKHMDELADQSFDYIVTVCDRARETCPTWPSDPERIHWSFPDPTAVEGSEEERYRAFEQIALQLTTRIRYLLIMIDRGKGEHPKADSPDQSQP
jgi:thioredoxin type arsenate reductase